MNSCFIPFIMQRIDFFSGEDLGIIFKVVSNGKEILCCFKEMV